MIKFVWQSIFKYTGGFEKLDDAIKKVRTQVVKDLIAVYLGRQVFGIDNVEIKRVQVVQEDVADLMEST